MAGVVTLAGLFPAGSVVDLVAVEDERVLRAEGGELAGRRVVDAAGNVGFAGLRIGNRFIATGYRDGRPLEVRCTAVDEAAPSAEIAQPPVGNAPVIVGTQNQTVTDPPPAAPVGLGVGVPEAQGVAPSQEPEQPAAVALPPQGNTVEAPGVPPGTSDAPTSGPAPSVEVASARDRLVAQGRSLDVANAENLTAEELRQSIVEKNATPVA